MNLTKQMWKRRRSSSVTPSAWANNTFSVPLSLPHVLSTLIKRTCNCMAILGGRGTRDTVTKAR